MHENAIRVVLLGALLLVACGDGKPNRPATQPTATDVAGGESSEFSGGSLPGGFCAVEVSRTALDLTREDVAPLVELAAGHHELALRWSRRFPDDAIRGFETDTTLLLDVAAIAAEDVVCKNPDFVDYGAPYPPTQLTRHLDLEIALSTTDGAVQATFPARFYLVAVTADRVLLGGGAVDFEAVAGELELGLDPGLVSATQTLSVQLRFDRRGVQGTLDARVSMLVPRMGGSAPLWSPITGVFPAPDAGCDAGTRVSLDEPQAAFGATPRAAHDAAFDRFSTPITAVWQDPARPDELVWTEVSLDPGLLTHACATEEGVDLYTSLQLDSSDGLMRAELPAILDVELNDQPIVTAFTLKSRGDWLPRAEFEAAAGVRGLDLGRAEYGTFALYEQFSLDHELNGELHLSKWENYFERRIDGPSLLWCAGRECDRRWCMLTARAEADCL